MWEKGNADVKMLVHEDESWLGEALADRIKSQE